MRGQPSEPALRWAAEAIGASASVVSVTSLHTGASPWLLHIEHRGRISAVVLRISGEDRIPPALIATGAAALQVAEEHGLAAPRLIASDLDGHAAGAAMTLETALSGTSSLPAKVSPERLREAGAAIAKVHAVALEPQPDLPLRIRPIQVDDHALERRWATLYRTSAASEQSAVVDALCELTGWTMAHARQVLVGPGSSPLLQLADDRIRQLARPSGRTVFVHGDIWGGNMRWLGDTCIALIDWKTAGAGDPGVDLGELRMQMAIQYGLDAPAHVLDGWQRESGRHATHVPYWDVVAALNTPAEMDGWPGFDNRGRRLGGSAIGKRRDAFLRAALDQLDSDVIGGVL